MIGWRCCNEMRIDLYCPNQCNYTPQKDQNQISPFPAFKSESNAELIHATKLFIDFWINHPLEALDNQSPALVAEQDADRLLEWLGGFGYPDSFPMNYLLEKLRLPEQEESPAKDPESLAIAYLDAVMTLNWDDLRPLTINQESDPELGQRYREIVSAIPTLQRIKDYKIIHAGIADDGISAIVYLEINRKYDWTMLFSKSKGPWLLRQQYAGSPALFYEQNKIHKSIAEALGAGKDEEAWKLIEPNIIRYPDSSDLRYYLGLYWQLVKQMDRAKVEYFNAVALDNDFYAPAFTLGALYLSENNASEAHYWFNLLAAKHPHDLPVQNNLAAAFAGLGKTDLAKEIWRKVLTKDPHFEPAKKNLERYR